MLTPVSTLLCRVKRRLPVAVVDLFGTFDDSSAVNGVISLRECLAEQPMALVLEVSHLSMAGNVAPSALLDLADDAANWPGARIALCGAGPGIRGLLEQAGADRNNPRDPKPRDPKPREPKVPDARLHDGGSRDAREPATGRPDASGDRIALYDRVEDAVQDVLRMPVPLRQSMRLAPERGAPQQAREMVARSCAEWRVPRLSQLAQVIVSELVTNGVVHARTPMELTVRFVGDVLHLAVRDGDPRLLVDPGGGVDADGHGYGRGLLIVDSMSDSWGCASTGDGKVVWARLAVPA